MWVCACAWLRVCAGEGGWGCGSWPQVGAQLRRQIGRLRRRPLLRGDAPQHSPVVSDCTCSGDGCCGLAKCLFRKWLSQVPSKSAVVRPHHDHCASKSSVATNLCRSLAVTCAAAVSNTNYFVVRHYQQTICAMHSPTHPHHPGVHKVCTQTYGHACLGHAEIQSCIPMDMHAYRRTVSTYVPTDIRTLRPTDVQTYRRTDVQTYMHAVCRHTDMHAGRHTSGHAVRLTMQTYIQAHRHII